MNPVARRSFMKGLGVLGLVGAGIAGYKEAKEQLMPPQDLLASKEIVAVLEDQVATLALMATYGEKLPPPIWPDKNQFIISNSFIGYNPVYKPGTEKQVQAKMQVGPDGKLYVKENDILRKI